MEDILRDTRKERYVDRWHRQSFNLVGF
jgi:hypothetical protein